MTQQWKMELEKEYNINNNNLDLRRIRIGKWKEKAQERNTWRLIVKEAKAHQGL
jgi:hypothetical protein